MQLITTSEWHDYGSGRSSIHILAYTGEVLHRYDGQYCWAVTRVGFDYAYIQVSDGVCDDQGDARDAVEAAIWDHHARS